VLKIAVVANFKEVSVTEGLYENNWCAIRGTFSNHVSAHWTVLSMFNVHAQKFERKLATFKVVVSTNVNPLTSPMCLSTKM
jgi:hypothetical protein